MPYKDPEKQKAAMREVEKRRKAKNGTRHKVWTLIFYPDSAPPEWCDVLSEIHLPIWVSPLHDRDTWTEADERENAKHCAGTTKKPHFHLVCQYEVQVDRKTFLQDFAFLKGPQNVKAVRSLVSMVRYLVHADDPDKAQYDREDVRVFGGAELDLVEQMGTHERHKMLQAMREYIRQHNVTDFCDFYDYCDDCEAGWARLLDDNSSYVIEKYIKSRRYKLQECPGTQTKAPWTLETRPVNAETGELLEEPKE